MTYFKQAVLVTSSRNECPLPLPINDFDLSKFQCGNIFWKLRNLDSHNRTRYADIIDSINSECHHFI